jgi:hypothetical protein
MKPTFLTMTVVAAALISAPIADAAQSFHPTNGQDAAKQASDMAECSAKATQQTGFDPARPPPPPVAASPQVAGSGARARGAAAGAVIGGAGGNAGGGAAAGAVAGGVAQRSRNRRAARAQNDAIAQQQQAGQAAFDHARTACLTGRGYAAQ